MPKRKHRPRAPRAPRPAAPRSGTEALLREFEQFARDLDLFIEDGTALVRTAIALKAERLGSPDPAAWTADEIRTVLTELYPSERPAARRLLVPTVTLYFGFLGRTGRWTSPLDEEALTALMESLAEEVPRVLDHRAASTPEAAGEDRDATPERSDGVRDGRADGAAVPPGPADEPGLFGPDVWPASLGRAPDAGAVKPTDADPGDQAESFARSALVRRARALLAWAAERRPEAPGGALTAADAADAAETLDLPGPRTALWENADLATTWVVLVATGHLDVRGDVVTVGRPLPEPHAPGFVDAATRLHATVLRTVLHRPDSPRLAALLLGAVLRAAGPDGLTVGDDGEPAASLAALAAAGVLDREGATYRLPVERHGVVPVTLEMLQADR